MSRSFDDFWWDTAPAAERMAYAIQAQAVPAVLFAKETVPFYRQHYRHLSVADIQRIASADEFVEVIPPLTKEHLARNHPEAFIPQGVTREIDPNRGAFFRFGTGGTTSKPVQVSHSITDWRALAIDMRRSVEFDFWCDPHYVERFGRFDKPCNFTGERARETPFNGARFIGGYNGDHITNVLFARYLLALGAEFHFRPSSVPMVADVIDQVQTVRATGVLSPPEGENTRKGLFLRDLLEADARMGKQGAWRLNTHLNPEFRFVIWSSMPISRELHDHLTHERGIPYIKGHYGSTEIGATSSTCSQHPRDFHLEFASNLVLLKRIDGSGSPDANELGYTLVSKTAGIDAAGNVVPPTGTMILNFMTGDAARLSKDGQRCACGRTTPVLYDTQRVEFTLGKALHGCQVS